MFNISRSIYRATKAADPQVGHILGIGSLVSPIEDKLESASAFDLVFYCIVGLVVIFVPVLVYRLIRRPKQPVVIPMSRFV